MMAEEEVRQIKEGGGMEEGWRQGTQSAGNVRLLVRFFSVSLSVTLADYRELFFFSFFLVFIVIFFLLQLCFLFLSFYLKGKILLWAKMVL